MADNENLAGVSAEVREALEWFVQRRHFGVNGDRHLATIRAEMLRPARENAELREASASAWAANTELACVQQELERAEAELADAKRMVWLIVRSAGGKVRIPASEIIKYSRANAELERLDRPDRSIVLVAKPHIEG